jgi:hypothetical protein
MASLAIVLTLWFHWSASQSTASDDHVKVLIDAKLNPAADKINDHIDKKVDPLSQKIDDLSERVSRLEGPLTKRVSQLETRVDQQASLAKVINPRFALATIRSVIQAALTSAKILPVSDLVTYKNAVQALPTDAYEYWTTAADIINYESFVDQLNHHAPDPTAVSHPCAYGLTGAVGTFHNTYRQSAFANCIVDLDTNVFDTVIFRNSVIRYHGGPVFLDNVQFVNCRFVLDIPASAPANPERDRLLMTLLESPSTKAVTVTSTHS